MDEREKPSECGCRTAGVPASILGRPAAEPLVALLPLPPLASPGASTGRMKRGAQPVLGFDEPREQFGSGTMHGFGAWAPSGCGEVSLGLGCVRVGVLRAHPSRSTCLSRSDHSPNLQAVWMFLFPTILSGEGMLLSFSPEVSVLHCSSPLSGALAAPNNPGCLSPGIRVSL